MREPTETGPTGGIGVRQPDRNLLVYYALQSLLLGPLFPVLLVPRIFKFRSLRYHLEDDGLSAEWGVLFRREVSLGYSRIQDIHLASNLVERWLGLARIQVQTASGSSGAEMTLEGLRDFEAVRDWIYGRMRGARGLGATAARPVPLAAVAGVVPSHGGTHAEAAAGREPPAVEALREATTELRRVRELLEAAAATGGRGPAR